MSDSEACGLCGPGAGTVVSTLPDGTANVFCATPGCGCWLRGVADGADPLREENARLREALAMFTRRLSATAITRVVVIDGPDDPKKRDGAFRYEASFTNGEMEDARLLAGCQRDSA